MEVKFECTRCGECCKNLNSENVVFLFPEDSECISSKLQLSMDEFHSKYCNEELIPTDVGMIKIHSIKSKQGICPFLAENMCTIHEFKPIQCQKGPFNFFWDGVLRFECMKTAVIPKNWDSRESDLQILKKII